MSRPPPDTTPPVHRLISAVPLGCGGILAAFLVTACGLAALTAVLSWMFGPTELQQVVVAVILAAAAVVTAIVIATQIAVSVILVEFAEDTDDEEEEEDENR